MLIQPEASVKKQTKKKMLWDDKTYIFFRDIM